MGLFSPYGGCRHLTSPIQSDPPYSYETHEWIHHTQVLFARSLARHRRPGRVEAEAFFRSEYVDSFEAAWKRRRFVAAMVYLDHHIDALDSGRIAALVKASIRDFRRFRGPRSLTPAA